MIRKFLISALLAAAGPALAVDGLPDSTFGLFSSGRNFVGVDLGGTNNDQLVKTLVSADGSIFLVGTSSTGGLDARFSVTKMTPDGILDTSFGDGGTVLSLLSRWFATSATFDNAGNILVAGYSIGQGTDRDFAICRFNQQGQPVNFSSVAFPCRTIAFDYVGTDKRDMAYDVLVEPNGKIVLVGVAGLFNPDENTAAVARLNPDGSLDNTFGGFGNGKDNYNLTENKRNVFHAIARRPDGTFVVVGESGQVDTPGGTDAVVVLLSNSGSKLGDYGRFSIDNGDAFNRNDVATAVRVLGDGSTLIGGSAQRGAQSDRNLAFVIKILPGSVSAADPAFASSGRREIDDGYSLTLGDMLVQSDGKIVVIGSNRASAASTSRVEVVRLNTQGIYNTSTFGTSGRTYIDYNFVPGIDYGVSGAFQYGHILVGGTSLKAGPANFDLTIARLQNDLIFANGVD